MNELLAAFPIPGAGRDRRHLIYSYFLEMTGIVDTFRTLFESFLNTDEFLKLNRADDSLLIELVKETINAVFAKSASSITPNLEQLRWNAYWRLFGYEIKGKASFAKVPNSNTEFDKTFRNSMYEIFQGILDQGNTEIKLGNPGTVSQLLNDLRKQLLNRTYNTIQDIADGSAVLMALLLALLDTKELMVDRLSIRATGRDRRLLELGEKLKAPVAKETKSLFILADRMETFLRRVEDTEWDTTNARALFEEGAFFREISSAWFEVRGEDFQAQAMSARRLASRLTVAAP